MKSGDIAAAVSDVDCAVLIILETAVSTLSNVDTCVLTTCNLAINISNIELPLTFSLLISTAQSTSDTAAAISPDLSEKFDSEKAILNELNNTIGKSNLIDSTIFANIANDINTIQGYMNSVSEIYDDMGYNVADFDNSKSQMGSSIANTLELVHNLESQLSDSITKLVDFKSSGTYHHIFRRQNSYIPELY